MTNLTKALIAQREENASKAKFYRTNRDIFLRYFDSLEQYEALINAGKFEKLEGIIGEKSNFKMG
tara:strand:+ start:13520 stop:13714 length:195 start_codon:yes stop_codon:yes gene_type:complete